MSEPQVKTIELSIQGICCAEEAQNVQRAISALPGVQSTNVLLASEKAIVKFDPALVDMDKIHKAVESAGCSITGLTATRPAFEGTKVARRLVFRIFAVFGVVFGVLLLFVVLGEMLGVFRALTGLVPWYIWAIVILVGGYPVLRKVLHSTLKRKVTSHTLMTVGLIAAIVVGEWPAAVLLAFFMRTGDYVEHFTTEDVRRSVKELTSSAPQQARVERLGTEVMLPVQEVQADDIVVIRPGEQIPVDGEVVNGQATINQATITGESMPVEAAPGTKVFAATLSHLGTMKVRTSRVGADTTFGRMVKMVEKAEAHRAEVQRYADKFSGYYLPVVAAISILTFVLSGKPLAAAAVLVVACSCAFAIATPIAMMASIGASARKGLLIKGGKYLELLARADVVLLDKTGTLTLGRPEITDVVSLNGMTDTAILQLAATAERYSEHPLAEAVRAKASEFGSVAGEPEQFKAIPGIGVRAIVDGKVISIGSRRSVPDAIASLDRAHSLEAEGKTLLFVMSNDEPVAILGASDLLRPEVPASITSLRRIGVRHIELLTGDNERTAAALAKQLGIAYQAQLLPEAKIAVVKSCQSRGNTVVMIGDGVNDAPALAQSDVGIAMGAAGSDVAIEAAHIALMREDWSLVPDVFHIARRTMRVVKTNIGFTALYNVIGLSLAAFGILPLIIAAALQSLPDIGMMINSSRLISTPRRHEGTPSSAN